MKFVRRKTIFAVVTLGILLPLVTCAEEGGSGHYAPGATASFIDTLPGKPGLAIANYFNYYDGSGSGSKRLSFGGLITANLDATAYSNTILALYQTPLQLLGGYYSVGAAIPYVWMEAKGKVRYPAPVPGGGTVTRSKRDSANGIGDITLYPFMLGWTGLDGQLKCDARFGIYAPTGDYDKGELANIGKNYWTFEPSASLSFMSSKMGLELTAFAGVDFNTENHKTDYHSGDQFHLDVTAAQHLPFLGGAIGVGANGFYYQQVTGDSGSGATLGDFRGRTVGVGPVVSYITKIFGKDLVTEIKWLPELSVKHRLEGDFIWFKLGMAF
jgi:hypothetical protein